MDLLTQRITAGFILRQFFALSSLSWCALLVGCGGHVATDVEPEVQATTETTVTTATTATTVTTATQNQVNENPAAVLPMPEHLVRTGAEKYAFAQKNTQLQAARFDVAPDRPNSYTVDQLVQREAAMQRALARKIPFSEVTVNRVGNLSADADVYEPQLYIRFNDAGVTVQASQVQLERILQDLCWQGGFDLDARLPLPQEASLMMHDAELSQVLSVLLREYSYVVTTESDGLVSKLVVMARDETSFGDALIQEAHNEPASSSLSLANYMAESESSVRRNLLRSQSGDTSEQVISFFQSVIDVEPELALRAQALAILSKHPSRSVTPVLAELASDPGSELRLEAAQRLMMRDRTQAMHALGQLAFNDADAHVRASASALLEQMPDDASPLSWASAEGQLASGGNGLRAKRFPAPPVGAPVSAMPASLVLDGGR